MSVAATMLGTMAAHEDGGPARWQRRSGTVTVGCKPLRAAIACALLQWCIGVETHCSVESMAPVIRK